MLIVERQQRLLDILRDKRTAQLEELAAALGVSHSTVRRDLQYLSRRGLLQSTRGGAVYQPQPAVQAIDQRMHEQVETKKLIGNRAAQLVEPGMTVYLDGGTTMLYTAQCISARPLQIITNSLTIATHFANDEQVELAMLGGQLYPRTGVLVGHLALAALRELHADLFLFSVAGIYGNDVFNSSLEMAMVERAVLQQAARNVLLADSTKINRKSLSRVCSLNDLDQIITDPGADPAWLAAAGSKVIVAAWPAPQPA